MIFENIDTGVINDEDLPWTPFAPFSDVVHVKLVKADPVRGETVTFMKAPAGAVLAKHHHAGTVLVYTIKGAWKYKEYDWVARPGSVVYETAATSHTPEFVAGHGDEVITLNITVGDLIYFDDNGQYLCMENWRSAVQRYLDYCGDREIQPKDVTAFTA